MVFDNLIFEKSKHMIKDEEACKVEENEYGEKDFILRKK